MLHKKTLLKFLRSFFVYTSMAMVSVTVIVFASACDGTLTTSTPPSSTLTLSSGDLIESGKNDGSFSKSFTAEAGVKDLAFIFKDEKGSDLEFSEGDLTEKTHFRMVDSAGNDFTLPVGLSLKVYLFSDQFIGSQLKFSLSGIATSHASTDNFDFYVKFENYKGTPSRVIENMNMKVRFRDTTDLSASSTTLHERSENDGQISETILINVSEEVDVGVYFNEVNLIDSQYSITNLPAGLSASLTPSASGDSITLSISGSATHHQSANSVSDVSLTLTDVAFGPGYPESSQTFTFSIAFSDNNLLSMTGNTLTEAVANDGSIGNTLPLTLTGGNFSQSSGAFTKDTHYTVTGGTVPAGLTPLVTVTSATTATISFSGNASANQAANNVSGIVFTFLPAAFQVAALPSDGSQVKTVGINFTNNAAPTLSYSGTTFTENSTNLGGITDHVDVTLSNDTYAIASGTFTANTHYTITNVPAGLTAVLTRTSSTVARLTFMGNATSHALGDSISNVTLTFLGAAFSGGVAPSNGSESEMFSIDFTDNFIMIYSAGNYTGNLGGRSGADSICDMNKPSGIYQTHIRALLSVDANDEIQDMESLYSIPAMQEVRSDSNFKIGDDWADLMDGSIDFNLLATAVLVAPGNFWWSGSDATGALNSDNCNGWTSDSSADSGASGFGADASDWMYNSSSTTTCDNPLGNRMLLCVAFE